MESRRRCYTCNFDAHRASYAKHLRGKKLLENETKNELIIPKWLFQEPIENKPKNI